jgi:hypothetical protein
MPRAYSFLSPLVLVTLAIGGCQPSSSSTTTPTTTPPTADGGSTDPADPTPDELSARGNCPAVPAGAGTSHSGTISADETWTAAGSPHKVTFDLSIQANVTVEPCAQVLVGKGYEIHVGSSSAAGSLVAHGTSEIVNGARDVRPVNFDAVDPASGWAYIYVDVKGKADLSIAAIQNSGGSVTNPHGSLIVYGVAGGTNDGPITQSTKVDRVLIEKSKSWGVNLLAWGAFAAGSDKLWIRDSGSADYPSAILIEPGVASTLPKTIVATGNVKDEILMQTSKAFTREDTLVNRGIPYRALGPIYLNPSADTAPVKLTVEAGVTLGFDENVGSGMYIGTSDTRQGILEAVGTATSPVVFTSAKATKAAGDWLSLYFKSTPAVGSKISYARIEYAGGNGTTTGFGCGPSDNDGAVFIHGVGPDESPPASAFIDHTTFENIGGSTVIVSGWVDPGGPNFTNDNTFGSVTPACKVSKPRRPSAPVGGDVCDGGRTTCW